MGAIPMQTTTMSIFFHENKKKKNNSTEFPNLNMMSCFVNTVTVVFAWTI